MNDSISHFSLRNLSNAILYSQIFGPLPRVKKYSREDLKNMGEFSVIVDCIKEGELVVIRKSRKLV